MSVGAGSSRDVVRQWRQLAAVPSLQGVYVCAFSTGGAKQSTAPKTCRMMYDDV
eukprot:SAG25_NODE_411_length_8395_cov_6.454556_9_plen_54_part_00